MRSVILLRLVLNGRSNGQKPAKILFMTSVDLENLLKTETDRIEWKETVADSDDILHAVCALANDLGDSKQPGYLIVGVKKDGSLIGINEEALDKEQLLIVNRLRSTKLMPTPAFSLEVETYKSFHLLLIKVDPYPVPPIVMVNSTAWIRSGSTTTRARDAELIRLRERRSERTQPFDVRPLPDALLDDLDRSSLHNAYQSAREGDSAPETFPSFEKWLTLHEKGKPVAGVWRPNPAAVLVYGRSPQTHIPAAVVEFVRYSGLDVDAAVVDRKTVTGSLPDQLDILWKQLSAHITEIPAAAQGARSPFVPDYPLDTLKELARNLVQHRVYEGTHAPGRIEWFEDRIEFSNAGGPFGRASEGEFGTNSDYRNPLITKFLVEQGYVERLGRGVRLANLLLEKNGNPPLAIEADGFTRVIVRKAR
jgi:ATP-dependent DNA helicase RecG